MKEIGEKRWQGSVRNTWWKRAAELARDLLAQYAAQTGQESTRLVTDAAVADPTLKDNSLFGGLLVG